VSRAKQGEPKVRAIVDRLASKAIWTCFGSSATTPYQSSLLAPIQPLEPSSGWGWVWLKLATDHPHILVWQAPEGAQMDSIFAVTIALADSASTPPLKLFQLTDGMSFFELEYRHSQ
jgi:hypothetical protein